MCWPKILYVANIRLSQETEIFLHVDARLFHHVDSFCNLDREANRLAKSLIKY